MKHTTPGRLLIEAALPEDLKVLVEGGPLDRDHIQRLMQAVAERYPGRYSEILQRLHELGHEVASTYGGVGSITPESLSVPSGIARERQALLRGLDEVGRNPALSQSDKNARQLELLSQFQAYLKKALPEEIKDNSFGVQMLSGARGKLPQLQELLVGSLIAYDSDDNPIPLPITRGFAEGLTLSQYWATAPSARAGLIGTKLATPMAGDLSNQLMVAARRLRITQEKEPEGRAGLPIEVDDPDYEGAVLARDVGTLAKRGEILTPSLRRRLRAAGTEKVLIHSPITSQVEYGVSRDAAGAMDPSGPPPIGAFAGVLAVQALTEPFTQANISAKHIGRRAAAGLDLVNQLLTAPSRLPFAAAVAATDGVVSRIHKLPTGGHTVTISGKEHSVAPELALLVKEGDRVEHGQVISAGVPDPSAIAQYRGLGAGRVEFARALSEALRQAGVPHNKRNVEFLARGLLNHVRMVQPYHSWLPGDLVEYNVVQRQWTPRDDAEELSPRLATGKYLEEPVAYHTVGTRLTPTQARELTDLGYDKVRVHAQAPPFEPELRRAREAAHYAPDWLERLSSSYLQRNLMRALYAGDAPADPTRLDAPITQLILSGSPAEAVD